MPDPVKLQPREIQAILRDHGPGQVWMRECMICGRLAWLSTYKAEPDDVRVELESASECQICQDVMHRAPEVFQWIAGVVGKLRRQLRDEVPEFDAGHPHKPKLPQPDQAYADQTQANPTDQGPAS